MNIKMTLHTTEEENLILNQALDIVTDIAMAMEEDERIEFNNLSLYDINDIHSALLVLCENLEN